MNKVFAILLTIVFVAAGCVPSPSSAPAPLSVRPLDNGPGPDPELTLSSPGEVFINEGFSVDITFDNVGDATGFGPIVELIVPPLATFTGATYLGFAITTHDVGIFPASGELTNPLTGEIVEGVAGDTLIVLVYPLGSFTDDQPPATIEADFHLSADAELGVPVDISAKPIFRFGADAEDNPTVDPPIHGDQETTEIIPTVKILSKTAIIHENETSTGPNFPVTYSLTLDIADGVKLDNISVTDVIPGNLQFIEVTDDAGGTVTMTPSTTEPGGTLQVDFGSITGTLGAERVITYTVYAPEFDDQPEPVIDPDTGASTIAENEAEATAQYGELDLSCIDSHELNLRSLSIQKGVSLQDDPQNNGISPLDTLRYTIDFQVSDYFATGNITVTDVVGDGQSFDFDYTPTLSVTEAGIPTSVDFDSDNYSVSHDPSTGTSTIIFSVSQQLEDAGRDPALRGGLYEDRDVNVGATTGTITFQTTIDTEYEDPASYVGGDKYIGSGDTTVNSVRIDANLLHNEYPVTEVSGTSVTVVRPTLQKSLYAINGDTGFDPERRVGAGDTVTYSLSIVVPTTGLEEFELVDYLPIPFLEASEVTGQESQGDAPPAAGNWRLADDDTLSDYLDDSLGETLPTLAVDATQNTLTFTYGTFHDTLEAAPRTAHILFTVTATSEPMADDLYLANLCNMVYQNSVAATATLDELTHIITSEPDLVITKGIESTDGEGTVDPPPDVLPVDGDLTDADAGDTVTYVITVENQGSWPAYDLTIDEDMPAGLEDFVLVSVEDGDGVGLGWSGDLFGAGLVLDDPLAADGTVIITFTAEIVESVYPRQTEDLLNTARITRFANTPDGPNFVQDQSLYEDDASITIASPSIAKSIHDTSEAHTEGSDLAIGETVTFRLDVTLPEGEMTDLTLVDDLPEGLAYVADSYIINTDDFVGTLGTLSLTADGGSGDPVTFVFQGTTTVVADNDPANNSFYILLDAIVLDVLANDGRSQGQEKTNRMTLDWDENPGPELVDDLSVFIVEPHLVVGKQMAPNPAQGGDQVTVTLTVENVGPADAFDVIIWDTLTDPPFVLDTVSEGSTADGFDYDYTSPTVTYNGDATIPAGEDRVFTFTVDVVDDAIAGSSYPNPVSAEYTSLDGERPDEERSYTASDTEDLDISEPGVVKRVHATSEPDDISAGLNVVIGEVITYELEYEMPLGITSEVSLIDELPTSLEYISGTALISRSSADITATDFTFTALPGEFESITPTPTDPLTFALGDVTVTSTPATLTVRFDVVVKNIAEVQRNTTIQNRGKITFTNDQNQEITLRSDWIECNVIVPDLRIDKQANPASAEGGDTITFTITAENRDISGSAPAFELVVTDELHEDYENFGNVSWEIQGSDIDVDDNSTATELDIAIDRLDPGESVVITFTADLKEDVVYGSTVSNTALLTGTSLPGDHGTGDATPGDPGTDTGERTGEGGVNDLGSSDDASVGVGIPTIQKVVVDQQSRYGPGQIVTYRVTVGLPTGTTDGVSVIDELAEGLVFVAGSLEVTVPSGVTTENAPGETSPFFAWNEAEWQLEFDFGQTTAESAANVILEYQVRVRNITSNVDGTLLPNLATLYYVDPDTGESTEIGEQGREIQVGEPQLTVEKSITSNSAGLQAGDWVHYEVVIRNDPAQTNTAYDVQFSDEVPAKLVNISDIVVTSTITPTPVHSLVDNTITLTIFDLPVADSVTVTFRAQLDDTVIVGETITNTAVAEYASAPDGGDGEARTYSDDDSAAFNVDSEINALKRVCPSLPGNSFTIGDEVIFEIRVDIIEGTVPDVTVVDTLPDGLRFLDSEVISGNAGMSYSNPDYNVPEVIGQVVTFNLGDVTNPANEIATDDWFAIEIHAVVEDVPGNINGETLTNNATVAWSIGSQDVEADINIIEPDLVITKTVDRDVVAIGSECIFTITVSHTADSTASAYDIEIVDTFPEYLDFISGSASLPAIQVDESGLPGEVVFTIPVLTLSESQTSFTFTCYVDLEAPVGEELLNQVGLTYTSQSGPSDDERSYTTEADSPIMTEIRTTITADKTVTHDQSGELFGGQTLTYDIVLTNTNDDVTDVVFTDPIPEHTRYIPGSLQTDKGTIDDSGDPLIVYVGEMERDEVVQIAFRVRVDRSVQADTVISNQGIVNSAQTTPHPSTLAEITAAGPGLTVGWEVHPINRIVVLAPWLSLLMMIAAGGGMLLLRRRRAQI